MARFTLHCERHSWESPTLRLVYDNQTSELLYEDGSIVPIPLGVRRPGHTDQPVRGRKFSANDSKSTLRPVHLLSHTNPAGKARHALRKVKIQLGLSCNYSCEYCSQRFVPRAEQTGPADIEPFLAGLPDWLQINDDRIEFEFWGGEPLVYWKTLKPLVEALRERYPQSRFYLITNGSLLTLDKNAWLDQMGFVVSISHDGPGQAIRGPDPLDDPDKRAAILDLYKRLAPAGRFSFNAMLNRWNTSRAAICGWFIRLTGDPHVVLGEGAFIDAYDEGGAANSLQDQAEAYAYRREAYAEGKSGAAQNMNILSDRIFEFIDSLSMRRHAQYLGQKCGMDRADYITVDLNGNVLTCQNVSAAADAPNGESHRIGKVTEFNDIKLNTSTHWSHRPECPKCPVLQLCKGSCMFLEGELFQRGCDNSFSDHIVAMAMAIEFITGYVPVRIEGPQRADRQDIWGKEQYHTKPRRVIPIIQKR